MTSKLANIFTNTKGDAVNLGAKIAILSMNQRRVAACAVASMQNAVMTLLHITSRTAWDSAGPEFSDPSLQSEGFIHCSTEEQVLTPANERFAHQSDLVLLVINADLVPSDLIFEDSYGSGTEYPHIYGTIPRAAVSHVIDFPCNPDGTFDLPPLPE